MQWESPSAGIQMPSVVARETDVEAGRCLGKRQAATRQSGFGGHGTCAQIEGAQADLDNLNPTSSLTDYGDYSDYSDYGVGQSEAEVEAESETWWDGGVVACGGMGILFGRAWAVERPESTAD